MGVNTTIWRDNMLIFKVSLRKRRLSGKANLNSSRSRKSNSKRIMRKHLSNSNQLLINFRDLKMKINKRMIIIMELLCNKWKANSRKNLRKEKRPIKTCKTSLITPLED